LTNRDAPRDDLHHQLNINVGGAQNVTSTFIPLLQKGSQKKIGFLYDDTSTLLGIVLLRGLDPRP